MLGPFLLGRLADSVPRDAAVVLAITAADLSPRGPGSWAFGQAQRGGHVGVFSFHRQGDPDEDYPLCLRRSLKVALHETGHTLGLAHCREHECAMNGSHHREESDSHPVWFCNEDEQKIWWTCPVDPQQRYRRLAAFAESHGMPAEARFWNASLAAIQSAD